MENFKNFIGAIQKNQIIDIVVGVLIYILFRCLAYITVKIFKPKAKNKKVIRDNAFYTPLIAFYTFFGAYLGILFVKSSLGINENVMNIINKIFKISVIIIFANGIANSLTTKGTLVNKLKEKINPDVDESMFRFVLKAIRIVIYLISSNRIKL